VRAAHSGLGVPRVARNDRQPVAHIYTHVYTLAMTARAKIFHNGGSQAVRLPKACRFPDDQKEVLVHRSGRRVILEPADEWSDQFRKTLGAWKEPIERPRSRPLSKMKDPFE